MNDFGARELAQIRINKQGSFLQFHTEEDAQPAGCSTVAPQRWALT
jgi:hypothetical protein